MSHASPGSRWTRRQYVLIAIFVAISVAFEVAAYAIEKTAPLPIVIALVAAPAILALVVAALQRGGWLRFLVHGFTERPPKGTWHLAPRTDGRDD